MRPICLGVALTGSAHALLLPTTPVAPSSFRHPRRPAGSLPTAATAELAEPEALTTLTKDPTAATAVAEAIVCARGVCVVRDEAAQSPEVCHLDLDSGAVACLEPEPGSAAGDMLSVAYLWPRALLLVSSVLYGTNFPLGRVMNEALPAAASSSARFLLAGLALSPFLLKLEPSLRARALLCGCFTSLGYISQSVALVDTPAAEVAFLGALTVVVCPALEGLVDGRKLGIADAPQTWLAGLLCLSGVALLELGGGGEGGLVVSAGAAWSVAQAVGFGTSFYLTERMMAREPTQALPITACQCAVVALTTALWAGADGLGLAPQLLGHEHAEHAPWLLDEATRAQFALPGLVGAAFGQSADGQSGDALRTVALAAAWTGLVTTAANRVAETVALGKMGSSEASVLLATEPLWAALFATLFLGEALGPADGAGGVLILAACLVNSQSPGAVRVAFGIELEEGGRKGGG